MKIDSNASECMDSNAYEPRMNANGSDWIWLIELNEDIWTRHGIFKIHFSKVPLILSFVRKTLVEKTLYVTLYRMRFYKNRIRKWTKKWDGNLAKKIECDPKKTWCGSVDRIRFSAPKFLPFKTKNPCFTFISSSLKKLTALYVFALLPLPQLDILPHHTGNHLSLAPHHQRRPLVHLKIPPPPSRHHCWTFITAFCWTLVLMMTKKQRCKLSSEIMSFYECMMFKVSMKGTGRIRSQGRNQEMILKAK